MRLSKPMSSAESEISGVAEFVISGSGAASAGGASATRAAVMKYAAVGSEIRISRRADAMAPSLVVRSLPVVGLSCLCGGSLLLSVRALWKNAIAQQLNV